MAKSAQQIAWEDIRRDQLIECIKANRKLEKISNTNMFYKIKRTFNMIAEEAECEELLTLPCL